MTTISFTSVPQKIVDDLGRPTRPFQQFLLGLFDRVGGSVEDPGDLATRVANTENTQYVSAITASFELQNAADFAGSLTDNAYIKWNGTGYNFELDTPAGNPVGSDGQIQYNNGGVFGASNITYNDVNGFSGFGSTAPTSTVDIAGSLATYIQNISAANSPFNIGSTSHSLRVDASTGAVVVNLPDAATCTGRIYNFKLIDATNSLTIQTDSTAQTIDGSTNAVLSLIYDKLAVQAHTNGWDII